MKRESQIKVERIMKAQASGANIKTTCRFYGLSVAEFKRLKNEYYKERSANKVSNSLTAPEIKFKPQNDDLVLTLDEEVKTETSEVCKEHKRKERTIPKYTEFEITTGHMEALRIAMGYKSLNELAMKTGISRSTLTRFPMSRSKLFEICGILKVTPEYIANLTPIDTRHYNSKAKAQEEEFKAKFNELSEQLTNLHAEIETLNKDKKTLESKVHEYECINNGLQKKITSLMEENKKYNAPSTMVNPDAKIDVLPPVDPMEFEKQKKVIINLGRQNEFLQSEVERYKKIVDRMLG